MKSPKAFACDPIRMTVEPDEYSQSAQMQIGEIRHDLTMTYGGTQTFTAQGRPFDNDND